MHSHPTSKKPELHCLLRLNCVVWRCFPPPFSACPCEMPEMPVLPAHLCRSPTDSVLPEIRFEFCLSVSAEEHKSYLAFISIPPHVTRCVWSEAQDVSSKLLRVSSHNFPSPPSIKPHDLSTCPDFGCSETRDDVASEEWQTCGTLCGALFLLCM